jgi:hypothetical protein
VLSRLQRTDANCCSLCCCYAPVVSHNAPTLSVPSDLVTEVSVIVAPSSVQLSRRESSLRHLSHKSAQTNRLLPVSLLAQGRQLSSRRAPPVCPTVRLCSQLAAYPCWKTRQEEKSDSTKKFKQEKKQLQELPNHRTPPPKHPNRHTITATLSPPHYHRHWLVVTFLFKPSYSLSLICSSVFGYERLIICWP